ncbi:uncharacterized protein [Rutidosis leptorrhynchoides]|uniref:uncharacterized protein n=1 Tax=Rutidosis leptorrhynchoides TaxID=125765 RepID=UPI003A995D56
MVENVSLTVLREAWKGVIYEGIQVASNGRSGGLVSCWRADCFTLKDHFDCHNWVATLLTYLPSNTDVLIINVYAPQSEIEKKIIWFHIAKMINGWNGPTCVMGDFNSTCFPHERLREEIDVVNMANFNDFISSASLIDQNIQNLMYTWDGPGGKKSRIDRVLVNVEWINLWPGAVLLAGDKSSSDHNPLIWGKKSLFWGPKPFRFFNGWFEVPKFVELKRDLKIWNNEHVNKSKLQLAVLESQIHDFL